MIHGRCNPNLKLVPCSSNNNNTRLTIWPRACRELVFPRDPSPFPRWQRGLCPLACPPRQSGAGVHYIVTCRGLGGLGPGSELKTSGTQQRTPRFTLDARAWRGRKRESTRRGRGKGLRCTLSQERPTSPAPRTSPASVAPAEDLAVAAHCGARFPSRAGAQHLHARSSR